MLTKKLVLPAVVIVLVGGATFGVVAASAQSPTGTPLSGLAQAIASKFHLNQNDIQSTINDWHTQQKSQMQQRMQQRLSDKLDQLVKDNKITASQKQAILDKLNQLKNDFSKEDWKSKTPQERRALMQQQRTDIENWAKSQGIDPNVLSHVFSLPRLEMRRYMMK
jgi:hypothetical protein